MEKEMNNWFIIGFYLYGEYIKHQIDLHSEMFKKGRPLGHWHYYFWVKDHLIDIFGSVDVDGNVRTSGDIGDDGIPGSAFGIDVYDDPDHDTSGLSSAPTDMIDDIDFLECDL